MDEGEVKFFTFLVEKAVKHTYISHIRQVEDMRNQGVIEDEEFEYLRNRILDTGNEQIRHCKDAITQYLEIRK